MERVVVTGLGAVTPIGVGHTRFWSALLEEQSGFQDVSSFDTSRFKVHRGAEVRDFDANEHVFVQDSSGMGRASQLAIAAGREALAMSGIDSQSVPCHRLGIAIGTTSGEPNVIEELDDRLLEGRPEKIDEQFARLYPCHTISGHVAREFGFAGPSQVIPTACAAGNYAVAHAMDVLQSGTADVMLAGGADAFSRITYTGFYRLGAIAPDVVRPFDKNRQGMIPGEGSGMLVLETESHARSRNASIYAEVAGYGLTCDAFNMTAPSPGGEGAARAMRLALKNAKVNRGDVHYLCAHGTGTKANDEAETKAIHRAFGQDASRLPVSSIKSMIGHTMGAASAIECVACVLSLQHNVIPSTANFVTPDPSCDLDYVTTGTREQPVTVALNNANAFGGNNASVVLKSYAA